MACVLALPGAAAPRPAAVPAASPAVHPAASAAAPAAAAPRPTPASPLRVCVYHDDDDGGEGRLHAVLLSNLVGHFREAKAELLPASAYRRGGLSGCDRAAYLGIVYGSPLPSAFLDDVARSEKPFLWINYSIEALQQRLGTERFARKTGFYYYRLEGFAADGRKADVPDFYRYFWYKGARLAKTAYRQKDGRVVASPELHVLGAADGRVLSEAEHSRTGKRVPYAVRKGDFFYVADNPFVYIHERDRYLVVADLVFDWLKLPPRERQRKALIRLEDVHPKYDVRLLYKVIRALKKKDVPFAISVIPEYVRPGARTEKGYGLERRRAFLRALRFAEENGGVLLLHGMNHNVAQMDHCKSLGSAADYEFWDRCRNQPLPYDTESWARKRLSRAKALVAAAGVNTVGWVTPHYAASETDYRLFGKLFDRTIQRVSYRAVPKEGAAPRPYYFMSQFFPYTIYRDQYGQFVWPENLGFVPMPGSDWGAETPADIAGTLPYSGLVRDSWASFFWHPQLAAQDGGLEKLEDLIDAVRARGYRFVSLRDLKARGE